MWSSLQSVGCDDYWVNSVKHSNMQNLIWYLFEIPIFPANGIHSDTSTGNAINLVLISSVKTDFWSSLLINMDFCFCSYWIYSFIRWNPMMNSEYFRLWLKSILEFILHRMPEVVFMWQLNGMAHFSLFRICEMWTKLSLLNGHLLLQSIKIPWMAISNSKISNLMTQNSEMIIMKSHNSY